MYKFRAVPFGVLRGALKGRTSIVVVGVVVVPYRAVAREMICFLSESKCCEVAKAVEVILEKSGVWDFWKECDTRVRRGTGPFVARARCDVRYARAAVARVPLMLCLHLPDQMYLASYE